MLGVAYKKGGSLKGRGSLQRAGGAYFPLELEVSLIYMFLPKNILEHSISFHPVPSPSSMFQGVTCTGFVTFCHLLEHSGSFLAHSNRFSIILAYSWDIPFPCLLVVLILSYLIDYLG